MKKYILIILITLSGCATSLNQKFAVGYGLNTISRNLTTVALENKQIEYERAVKLYVIQNATRDVLDTAWRIRVAQPDKAKLDVRTATETLKVTINELEKEDAK